MYLLTIHVPIYVQGGERFLSTDWKRSLVLLRDSLRGRFGRVQVVSPVIDATAAPADQELEPVLHDEEIDLFPSFPRISSARDFWQRHIHTWRQDIAARLSSAQVVHAGFCDVYRPMNFVGFLSAYRAGKPTVFVQDTDQVLQLTELAASAPILRRVKTLAYCAAYEHSVRFGVARASLSLLKGQTLNARYGRYARNANIFHDTSYLANEVAAADRIEERVGELVRSQRPMRLVYCGRLEARKGIDHSISAVARARSRGARITFDIIGHGDQRAALERQASDLRMTDTIRFLGSRKYGRELLAELAGYDALLFTPLAEDTPRMIFDGYAAGLPLLAYGIAYVQEREAEDRAGLSVATLDSEAMATLICRLDQDRTQLAALARRARQAGLFHAADTWYARRAAWTLEAVERHRGRN